MELDVWSGDWGLPSIDHACLSAMAYCKFANIPITIKKTNNPWRSPSGDLPLLKFADRKETRLTKIFEEFRQQNYNADQTLSEIQSADTVAFTALLDDKLLPAILYLWWADVKTYSEMTRPWYAKAVGLPFSLYLPHSRRNKALARLRAPYVNDPVFTETDLEYQVVKDAKECLNLMSTRLGNNDFYFDDRPTTLDAIVFGYLVPLLKMPVSNPLQVHLKACRNLVNFCNRIISNYFPLSPEEQEAQRQNDEASRQQADDSTEFPHRKRNMILAGLTVVVAMAAYAVFSGIVQIELVNEDRKLNTARDESELVHLSQGDDDPDE